MALPRSGLRGLFLRAYAQTALLDPGGLVDYEGRALADGFPRVYPPDA